MIILCTVDITTREVTIPSDQRIASYDHKVDVIRFQVETIPGFSLDTSSIRIAAQGPNKARHDYAVDPSTVQIEEETGYITFDWPIPAGVTEMPEDMFGYGATGQLIFAVCAEIISGSTLSKAWHSDDGIITVVAHLEPEAGGGEDPSETATNAQKIAQLQTDVAVINTQIGALANGSPTPVATVAEMTDESAVYLYTGSETGYTAGNWYYYNGTAWTSGGVYGGVVTDTTLELPNVPADSETVGLALAGKADASDLTGVEGDVSDLKDDLGACEDDLYDMIGMFEFSWEKGGMASSTGINYNSDSNIRTNFKPVSNAKSIIVKNTSESTAAVYEFAGNQTTASGINERLAVNYIAPNTSTSITLNANTAYIRCQLPSGTLTDGDYYLLVYTFNSIIANEFKSAFKRGDRLEYGLDLNNYTDSGYYGLDGSEYQNSPARDGVLIVYNYYNTIYISQMLLTFSNVNKSRCYIRSGRAGDNPSWTDWVELLRNDTPVISNNKIAVFGDSIMSGTVKTPTSNQTHVVGLYIQQQLKTKVVDGAIGSIGYISRGPLSYNILELVKSVDLSGCKFFVCSAGDNDYQYPIGVYTDTNADYSDYAAADSGATVMGNIYKLCKYLHETYNDMTIVLCNKPNATTSGTFPTYRRTIGTRVQQLNAELKAFCEYYGCGFIDFDKIGFDGWMLPQVLENDGVHLTADGYKKLSVFISGELLKFTGTGDCLDSTTDRVTYPS